MSATQTLEDGSKLWHSIIYVSARATTASFLSYASNNLTWVKWFKMICISCEGFCRINLFTLDIEYDETSVMKILSLSAVIVAGVTIP